MMQHSKQSHSHRSDHGSDSVNQDASASSSATGALPLPQDMVLDRLRAMLYQESRGYDYNAYFPDPDLQQWNPLNHEWREKICQWTYNVVDTYDLPREIVALSLNYFDRFLATRGNQCNGTLALLVSLTTLHIAMKVHSSTGTFKLQKLAELSRGQFGPHHIEQMEWQIMSALQFKLHPPTLFAFVSYYLMLFPQQQSQYDAEVSPRHSVRKELFEVAIYMAELSVCDSFFVPYPTSMVALAALANVMDGMPPSKLSVSCKERFWDLVSVNLGLVHPQYGGSETRTTQLQEAKDRLRHMFQSTPSAGPPAGTAAAQPNGNGNGLGNSSIQSTASLTSSPTSAAEMMAMEEWNESSHYQGNASANMDCGRDDHRMSMVQHPDTEDEGDEGASFRYSPSPPMNQASEPERSARQGFKQHRQHLHHGSLRYSHHQENAVLSHNQQQHYRQPISSSSPTSFLARSSSPASRARMACSPIVASVQ
jgi:Cyclin, N-terminal domain/Cyclin, C-terminal domain